jgi:hypothetical protein
MSVYRSDVAKNATLCYAMLLICSEDWDATNIPSALDGSGQLNGQVT